MIRFLKSRFKKFISHFLSELNELVWLINPVAYRLTFVDQEMLPQQQQKIINPNKTVKYSNHRIYSQTYRILV